MSINLELDMIKPRITIVLHPNTSFVELVTNDRRFNDEQYAFSRKAPPAGDEAVLLDGIDRVIGIDKVEASKNTLRLEISDGMRLHEFIPAVVGHVKGWGGKDYEPEIFCDDRRWTREPVYGSNEFAGPIDAGVKVLAGTANLGIEYKVWRNE